MAFFCSRALTTSKLPWLIARYQADFDKNITFFKFYQLSFETNKFLPIPELSLLSLPPPPSQSSSSSTNDETDCVGYSHGWMALFSRSTSSVSLFNPLTNSSISLPVLKNGSEGCHPDRNNRSSGIHLYLTSDPGESLSNCFALVIATFSERILYCKVGCSDNWVEMPHPEFYRFHSIIHVCSYLGQTYIASHGDVFVCNFGLFGCNQISLQKILGISFSEDSTSTMFDDLDMISESYMVESDGDLLLVLYRFIESVIDECFTGYYFKVFKLEVGLQFAKAILVDNLGDKALFLSPQTVFSLTASKYPGCKGNTIYYTCGFEAGYIRRTPKLRIYELEKGRTVTIDLDDSPLPDDWENCSWFTPSLLK